ncbi:MAG: hypothetical protein ACI4VK_00640 [Candidatus Coproplasma sp.]
MKKFKFKSLAAALAALIFAVPMASAPAFANSAAKWEEGITSTGIHCVHEDSVLEVKEETLTFNIGTPLYELQDGEKYNTTVTAEYTFYNPTDETVNTKMAFPIGLMPYYAKDNEKIDKVENPITVDGQPVEYTLRHTYGTYNSFEEDVKKIRDAYYETDFFKPDSLHVYEYVFKVNLADYDYATFKVKMPSNEGTRYFCNTDGSGNFYYTLNNGDKFSIFVLGNDYDLSNLNWSVTRYSSVFGREIQVNGSVTLEKKMEPKTFESYVLQGYDSQSDVSVVDYYNAMFELIYTDGIYAGTGILPVIGNNFTEWYVYETSVAPGGTFKNSVTAILYPTVYYYYTPYVYEYNYYLSPAREWASFGNLTVNINTTQYLQKGDYYNPDDAENSYFTKTETGYTATFTSLPTTELSFRTCSVETSVLYENTSSSTGLAIVGIILCAIFVGGPLVTGLVMLIIFLVQRKKKKKAASNPPADSPDQTPATDLPSASNDMNEGIAGGEADGANTASQAADGQIETQEQQPAVEEQDEHKFCMYCGSNLESGVKFCPNCGGAVQPVKPTQAIQSAPVPDSGKRVNGFGIAGFVLSILSLFAFGSPMQILIVGAAFGLSLAGVILRKKLKGVYGLAIAGLAISSAVIVIDIIVMLTVCLTFGCI